MSKNKEVSELEKQILDQFMSGQNLFGEGGCVSTNAKERYPSEQLHLNLVPR